MTFTLSAAVLPIYVQMLDAVLGVLGKAQEFCAEGGATEEEILKSRLAPDMLTFDWQVKALTAHVHRGLEGALTGRYEVDRSEPPKTLAALSDLVAEVRAQVAALDPADLDARIGGEVLHVMRKSTFATEDFVMGFSMPNFYFHAVTAYDILRSKGIKVGKADFLG